MKKANLSSDDDSDSSSTAGDGSRSSRDEVNEVKKMSSEETNRIRLWRLVVTACLICSGVLITIVTYRFLVDEQKANFEVAFDQFSRSLSDSALNHQRSVREGMNAWADTLALSAIESNETWPFVTLRSFEAKARHFRKQIGAEFIGISVRVSEAKREEWLSFTNKTHGSMVREGHLIQKGTLERLDAVGYKGFISKRDHQSGEWIPQEKSDEYFPMWSYSPPPASFGMINVDLNSFDHFASALILLDMLRNQTVYPPVRPYVTVPLAMSQEEHDALHSDRPGSRSNHPHTVLLHAIPQAIDDPNSPIVGNTGAGIAWDFALRNLLPSTVRGIVVIIENSCDQLFTYNIDGSDAFYQGEGDFHDRKFDHMKVTTHLTLHIPSKWDSSSGHCHYSMNIYPSSVFKDSYDSNVPIIFAILIAASFAIVITVFYVYDMHVEKRNKKVILNAAHSNAIVSSLFPGTIRDRLINQEGQNPLRSSPNIGNSANLKNFLKKGGDIDTKSKPLAELFLETTVMFADIVGFTAWSSVREPPQVFIFLETVYAAFDATAARRRVYKVETVGDCYVAVAGLPEPRKDHAVVMARFACDVLHQMVAITKELEKTLGPDTGDLSLRIGLHSGPVTAGVLRGERARFQLFGDTMNTCARMESTSEAGKIQLSAETANELLKNGKANWFLPRPDRIYAKGKGELNTFFVKSNLNRGSDQQNTENSSNHMSSQHQDTSDVESVGEDMDGNSDRKSRLIDWNVEKLVEILRLILARREVSNVATKARQNERRVDDSFLVASLTPLDEVKEIIALPKFNGHVAKMQRDPDSVQVPQMALDQIRDYVTCIANMYRSNPFHNFDHASHVVMSVTKLLSRIVAPSDLPLLSDNPDAMNGEASAATLHDHTYGITSDPLTQFSCAWSALIHDVDHTGVPNTQLVKENTTLAQLYKNRSVAEQNSLDLSWKLFMDKRYDDFRKLLCPTVVELRRFRQLVVNCVMATDIMDRELKILRNNRWERAFNPSHNAPVASAPDQHRESAKHQVDRKATIVIEHLIQASDVAHTMQHWHVYRKWNENLFREMYKAYQDGRADNDPTESWYSGEMGFMDFYVIPLARKLKDCGVFGISSDEYLTYVMGNRVEWERRGKDIVAEMVERIRNEGIY